MTLRSMMLPAMLIVLIASTVVVHVVMLVVAARDPSFAVTDDPDRDAAWATAMQQRRENERLGWRVDPRLRAPAAGGAPAILELLVSDGDGRPVRGLDAAVRTFHKAWPNEDLSLVLTERGEGRYVGALMPPRPGFWRLEVDLRRDADRYAERLDAELVTERDAGGGGGGAS